MSVSILRWKAIVLVARIVAVLFLLFLAWLMLGLVDKALLGEAQAFERCSWKTVHDSKTSGSKNVLVCCDTETGDCRRSGG